MPNIMITLDWNQSGQEWKKGSLNEGKKMLQDGYGIADDDCIDLFPDSLPIGKTLTGDTIIISAHAGNGTLGFNTDTRLSALGLFNKLKDIQDISRLEKIVIYACSMGVEVDSKESFASTLARSFSEMKQPVLVYAPLGISAFNSATAKFSVRNHVNDKNELPSDKSWVRCQPLISGTVDVLITSEPEMPYIKPEKIDYDAIGDWKIEVVETGESQ
ncbi:Uncharacterized protein MCB1EB_1083 [Mycoavidus cysteinexigens]|uniref:Uncharacterized protein n=1 Tax=Mycoavidus cysteinexigens TaxID=1553431 RepID=A0A2Z6EUW8_9BURK|nr:hypothetical protein [Mycoavidus cysteinexigens]BBE09244.1 Uncharacterized protein MCB1EB_1083 [Mycoavidus cysteinexigens]GLR02098.1 hypothetical protein GCM10007934_19120 [Mycoavidus cysteinexigens]